MIIHIDIDSFFASVEISLRPAIVNREVLVAHPEGMVLAANYNAKRKGVKTTDLASKALKMLNKPMLFNVRYGAYQLASEYFFESLRTILSGYKNSKMLQISIDECFIELTTPLQEGELLDLKNIIFEMTNLPVSIGAGSSKLIAKQASKRAKPFGVLLISKDEELDFLKSFELSQLWGFGPKTIEKLRSVGIESVNDLLLSKKSKILGLDILTLKNQLFDCILESESLGRSISVERSFRKGFTDPAQLNRAFDEIFNNLAFRFKESGLGFKNFELRVYLSDGSALIFKHKERQHTANINLLAYEAFKAKTAFRNINITQIRRVGMSLSNLSPSENLELFTDYPIYEIEPPRYTLLELIYYGMRVSHLNFGEGRIIELRDDCLVIEFSDRKRIIADYSSLLFSY